MAKVRAWDVDRVTAWSVALIIAGALARHREEARLRGRSSEI